MTDPRTLILASCLVLLSGTLRAAETTASLVIVGGALRFNNAEVWSRVVELAGGRDAKIAVFPTASGYPIKNGNRTVENLNKLGAQAFLVPLALAGIDADYRQAARDPRLVAQVRAAGGVYFIGGDQSRITEALVGEDGKQTPLLEAIWDVYRQGGMIAGSSAGAAVMSRVMFSNPDSVLTTLEKGVTLGKQIGPGLGFMDASWFVEQHSLSRGRFARALALMQSQGFQYGIAVDENTALVVRGGDCQVIGYKGALVLDLSRASRDAAVPGFNLKNARLTYLDHGDRVDLHTLAVTPAPEKEQGTKIAPQAADFRPLHDRNLFFSDILGNTTVVDLLARLIGNKSPVAIGLAFDPAMARSQQAHGFEFRFYRDTDSVGWYTEAFGGEDYTIENVHLDIRPIEITGPQYK